MKICSSCTTANPDAAHYCMRCGQALPDAADAPAQPRRSGWSVLAMSVAGSLLVSFILIYVFRLPVFLLFGFLPLLWWRRKP